MEFCNKIEYTVSGVLSETETTETETTETKTTVTETIIEDRKGTKLPVILDVTSDVLVSSVIKGVPQIMRESNWVIRGLLCCGAYPDGPYDIDILFNSGIRMVINCTKERKDCPLPSSMEKIRVPLEDKKTIPDEKLLEVIDICENICNMMLFEQQKVYIHCYGGHGRTGLLVCIILHLLYGYTAEEAIDKAQSLHHMRPSVPPDTDSSGNVIHEMVRMPQTDEQIQQLHMLFGEEKDSTSEYNIFREYLALKRQSIIEKLN